MDAFRNCGQPCPSGEDSECTKEGETCQGFTGCAAKLAPGDEDEEIVEQTTSPSVFPSFWPSVAPSGQPSSPTLSGVFNNTPTWNGGTSESLGTKTPSSSSSINESSNNLPTHAPTDENYSDRPYLQEVVTASHVTDSMLSTSYNPSLGVYSPLTFSSQQAYGVVFDVESKESSPALLVRGVEFYVVVDPSMTSSGSTRQGGEGGTNSDTKENNVQDGGSDVKVGGTANDKNDGKLYYEVYTKLGSWHGHEGDLKAFQLVTQGSVSTAPLFSVSGNGNENDIASGTGGGNDGDAGDSDTDQDDESLDDGVNATALTDSNNGAPQDDNANVTNSGNNTVITPIGSTKQATAQSSPSPSSTIALLTIPFTTTTNNNSNKNEFQPMKLDGNSTRQSFYITLTTKSLLYQRSTAPPDVATPPTVTSAADLPALEIDKDYIVLRESPELIVYEGAAVMAYPMSKANLPIYYRYPRGFWGGIWYDRDACLDNLIHEGQTNENVDGEGVSVDTSPVDDENNSIETGAQQEQKKKEKAVVQAWGKCKNGARQPVEYSSSFPAGGLKAVIPPANVGNGIGNSIDTNVNMPVGGNPNVGAAAKPAGPPPPTTSPAPTIETMQTYLVMILDGVQTNRIMNQEEQRKFEDATLKFFNGLDLLDVNEVDLNDVKIWYQQLFETEVENPDVVDDIVQNSGDGTDKANATAMEETNRQLQEIGPNSDSTLELQSTIKQSSLEVTIIVSVLYTPLPQPITQDLLNTLLNGKKTQYLQSLKVGSPYFQPVTGINSIKSVDKVTLSPTPSPTTLSTSAPTVYVAPTVQLEPSILAVLIIGVMWTLLVFCSFMYLRKARDDMRTKKLDSMLDGSNLIANDILWRNKFEDVKDDEAGDGEKVDDDSSSGEEQESGSEEEESSDEGESFNVDEEEGEATSHEGDESYYTEDESHSRDSSSASYID